MNHVYVSNDLEEALKQWVFLNKHANSLNGYPVGLSYVDSRFGSRLTFNQKLFLLYDKLVGQKFPQFKGKTKDEVIAYLEHYKNAMGEDVVDDGDDD